MNVKNVIICVELVITLLFVLHVQLKNLFTDLILKNNVNV